MKKVATVAMMLGLMMTMGLATGCGGGDDGPQMTKEDASKQGKSDWPYDYCEVFGWYGDGICDPWCPLPDPDCGGCDMSSDCAGGEYCTASTNSGTGECLIIGQCNSAMDCDNPDNHWARPRCLGPTVCEHGQCGIECGSPFCGEDADCPEGFYCDEAEDSGPYGSCKEHGSCEDLDDCWDEGNQWYHPACMGHPVCEQGHCGWVCDELPVVCETSSECHGDQYCAVDPLSNSGWCLDYGKCVGDHDCYNSDNDWSYPEGWGITFSCEDGTCEWSTGAGTCADEGGTCMSDPNDPGFAADCEALGLITVDAACPAFNQSCCKNADPIMCADVGGVCVSGMEPPPPSLCDDRGLSATTEGVCFGFDEICCVPRDCGGIGGFLCPDGFSCNDILDDCDPEYDADCLGFCAEPDFEECAGFFGLDCPNGYYCLDIPHDTCDPLNGGADCGGYCVPW